MDTMDKLDELVETARKRITDRNSLPNGAERKRIRTKAGITQEQMARLLGDTHKWNVVAYEAGRANPTGERLARYAEILRRLRVLDF